MHAYALQTLYKSIRHGAAVLDVGSGEICWPFLGACLMPLDCSTIPHEHSDVEYH